MKRTRIQEDEVLERLWHLREDGETKVATLAEHLGAEVDPALLLHLAEGRWIYLWEDDQRVELTARGLPRAQQLIRAHRLGERLIHDAFGGDFETGACEFEHIVTAELVDAICTLLGHPRECPHGSPIPEGACCRRAERVVQSPAVPLTELEVGQSGRVVYVRCADDSLLHKIEGLQIRPGVTVSLHQRYPTFVIECQGANIALSEEVAAAIRVWHAHPAAALEETPPPPTTRNWISRLLRRP
ncbi:MAG TPA: metal-dependent transcriptional regulator [Deferrisomatales bacterium]|nr:metal-dependent transcriptional regulator [Deferrisomatales bacterium]